MSEFFIRRPIVAIVIAVLMVLIGTICLTILPISQYPEIVPPEIQVTTHYTGADAVTIEQSVAAPLEQKMSGVDKMNYMYSTNANNGDMRLIVNFDLGTDVNIDQVLAQLRVSQAQSQFRRTLTTLGLRRRNRSQRRLCSSQSLLQTVAMTIFSWLTTLTLTWLIHSCGYLALAMSRCSAPGNMPCGCGQA